MPCALKLHCVFIYFVSSGDIRGQSVQWNLSNPDTLGTEESVLISGFKSYTNMAFGTAKSVEMSSLRSISSAQNAAPPSAIRYLHLAHYETPTHLTIAPHACLRRRRPVAHVVAVISLLLTSIPIGSCVASSPSLKMESSWSWLTNTSDYVKYSPLFPNPLVCIRDIVKTGSVEVSMSMDIIRTV